MTAVIATTGGAVADADAAVAVLAAVVVTVVAAQVQVLVAVALGDDLAREAGVLWDLRARVDRTGTLVVPALMALASGAAIAWPARPPVRHDVLSTGRRLLVAASAPTAAALLAVGVLALPTAPRTLATPTVVLQRAALGGVGGIDPAAATTIATVALLVAVFWSLPLPPVPGGRVVAVVLRGDAARRWDRLARGPVTPWGLAVGIVVVLADLGTRVAASVGG